jgi:hypothetical protein
MNIPVTFRHFLFFGKKPSSTARHFPERLNPKRSSVLKVLGLSFERLKGMNYALSRHEGELRIRFRNS